MAFIELASEIWRFLSTALNSKFSIAFVGSLAGAFGGAVAAQRIIERSKRREIFLKELRSTNAAIMVSFSICNIMLSQKKQHSLPLYEQFKKDQERIEEFSEKRELGKLKPGEKFEYVADFKTFSAPAMPVDTLKDLVFNNISAHGRVLSTTSVLMGSFAGLKEVLLKREALVEQFKTIIPEDEAAYYYFGLQLPTGHTSQEYPDIIEAIHSYVNDVIFFSSLICSDLMEHGEKLRAKEKRFAKNAPKINTADFNTPEASGLMPPKQDYQSWLDGYTEVSEKQ